MVGIYALQDPDGKNHPIEGIVQIGRDRLNHVHLRDPMISRLHATAWVDGEKVFLQDEGSSNGTFVNRMPVGQPIALQVGDKVQLGHTTLILVDTRAGWIHEPPPPMPIEAPPSPPPPQQLTLGFHLAMIGLAGLGFLACAIIAVLILGYANDIRSSPHSPPENVPTQPPGEDAQTTFRFAEIQTVMATSDGTRYYDERGISLRVPREATTEGATTRLVSSELAPALLDGLTGDYTVTSLAYRVAANGPENGTGRPELSFPASSDEARLGVLIDETYLAVLAIESEDGVLTIHPFLGAPEGDSLWSPEDVPVSANQYFVLEPTSGGETSRLDSPTPQKVSGFEGKGPGNARGLQEESLVDCGQEYGTVCVRNPSGTVYLTYIHTMKPADISLADTIRAIEGIMARYENLGFTAARLSSSSPM
jgi:hypothetical protein